MRELRRFQILPVGTLGVLVSVLSAQTTPPGSVAGLLAEGERQQQENHPELALLSFRAAREAAGKARDPESQAKAFQGMGRAEEVQSDFASAKRDYQASFEIREKLDDSAGMGEALNGIGNAAFAQGDMTAARGYYERSLKLREATGNRAGVAASWNNLGNTLRTLGFYLEAAEYLQRSAQQFQELGNLRSRSTVLRNLGTLYGYLGDYDRALSIVGQSLDSARSLGDQVRVSNSLDSLGVIHTWMGNYRLALEELNQARQLREEAKVDWGLAETLNNIGLAFQAQSDHRQALTYFGKALLLNQKMGDKGLEAESRLNIGVELMAEGRLNDSFREFDRSIALSNGMGDKLLLSAALRGLGRAQIRRGKTAESLAVFLRALALQKEMGTRAEIADTTVELAAAHFELGDAGQALVLAREAIGLATEISRPSTLWQARLVAAKALRRAGKPAEAGVELDRAIATIESLRLEVAGPTTALSAYFGDRLEAYRERVLVDLTEHDLTAALMHVERSKARALAETLGGGRVNLDLHETAEERQQERALENQLAALNILMSSLSATQPTANPADLRARLESKRRELEFFQTSLFARHPELAIQSGEMASIEAGELQSLAATANATILDYVVTADVTYLFVVRPTGPPRLFPIPVNAAALRKKTVEFRRQLASHDLGFAPLAQELYRILVAPAAAELRLSSSWIIVPDAALWDVAFQALESRPGRFLIEDAAISYAPSLAVLRETMQPRGKPQPGVNGHRLLALGNPAIQFVEDLPEAGKQLLALQTLYGESHSLILLGPDATEERFKEEAGRYDVVHLAAHAVLDDASPMYSRVLLATAMPGSREDGFLEAREMMNLNLHATMVVLSGCETAVGRAAPGEGITGMLWAMFVAGAPAIVASLWPVESASTSDLMQEFHRQWLASENQAGTFRKPAALRTAARKLIATPRYAHPFYWAGFIVAGNPN